MNRNNPQIHHHWQNILKYSCPAPLSAHAILFLAYIDDFSLQRCQTGTIHFRLRTEVPDSSGTGSVGYNIYIRSGISNSLLVSRANIQGFAFGIWKVPLQGMSLRLQQNSHITTLHLAVSLYAWVVLAKHLPICRVVPISGCHWQVYIIAANMTLMTTQSGENTKMFSALPAYCMSGLQVVIMISERCCQGLHSPLCI